MDIRAEVLAVPRDQRAALKGRALAQIAPQRAFRRSGEVELVSVRALDRGVVVMLRAWDSRGRPRGLGDGSIEIERVRLINPPICIPDPDGPINLDWRDDDGVVHRRRFREDHVEALWQALDHTLRVLPVHGPERTERGRVGRTVSTFYAGGGDGYVEESSSAVWATCHGAATGTAVDATTNPFRCQSGKTLAGNFFMRRAFIPFEFTSDIPDTDTISAATLSLFVSALTINGDNDGDDWFVPLGPTSQADPTTLATADYDQCGAVTSPTEFSNDRKDYSSHTVGTYADWVFNASGLANINKTGYTLIGLREGHDVLNSPYAGASNTQNQIRYNSSEAAGTTNDPVLVVTHAAAGGSILPLIAKDMADPIDMKDMRG